MKDKQNQIVAPFWDDSMTDKNKLELSHLAKFILCYDESIEIVEQRESPDFIVQYQGGRLGLEIERLFNPDHVAAIKSREAIFKKAAIEFERRYPGEKVAANLWAVENYQFSGKEIGEIADFVHQVIAGDGPAAPPYLSQYFLSPHSGVNFSYNEGSYTQIEMPATSLDEAISKKEAKLPSYLENTGLDRQWLLLISAGIGSDAFDLEDYEPKEYESGYEHIYLLQDFQAEVLTIK